MLKTYFFYIYDHYNFFISRAEMWKHKYRQCESTRQACSRATDTVCVKQNLGLILFHIWRNDGVCGKTGGSLGQPDPVWMCGWFHFKNAYPSLPVPPLGPCASLPSLERWDSSRVSPPWGPGQAWCTPAGILPEVWQPLFPHAWMTGTVLQFLPRVR